MSTDPNTPDPLCKTCDDEGEHICPHCAGSGCLLHDDGQHYDCSLCCGVGIVECEDCLPWAAEVEA